MIDKIFVEGILSKQLGLAGEEVVGRIEIPTTSANGDFAFPCFRLSKQLKKSPNEIAADFATRIKDSSIDRVEAKGGYLNIYLKRDAFVKDALKTLKAFGTKKHTEGKGKTITIDYSSINIAKPFHIGHLMSTAIGGSLYKIYEYLGYTVVGVNHLGDWGTQFGKQIVAYKEWGDKQDIEKRGVASLVELYQKFHEEAKKRPELDQQARDWFKKIEDGTDKEATQLFNWFKDLSLTEAKKTYERLGIVFDSYNGEAFYSDKIPAVVEELRAKKLLEHSQGAECVKLDELDMPPCLVLKDDGASLYATRDLACAKYRKSTYGFYKNLYVVAYQQALHFRQVFAVLGKMGYEWNKDCVHIQFGMVSIEGGGSLSTRAGNIVFLEDVLNAATQKALDTINNKNPKLVEKEKVAEQVGIGAIVFGVLCGSRIKDVSFSLEKALNFDGETGPYLQYTFVRCKSILKKLDKKLLSGTVDAKHIADESSFELAKLLVRTDEIASEAGEKYEPSILTRHLIDIAKAFNRFYLQNRIVGESDAVAKARAALTQYTATVLKKGMQLILLGTPEEM
ncbi:MAG: arginine--tRNA ligase [Firmicutes bacterium]|nr:arginine--tRNA ligase [Bacillota bacterium]